MTRSSRRWRLARALPVIVVLLAPALLGAAPRENRIFLSARAPWGSPRAVNRIGPACADTAWRDTLYLSFEPASDESTFFGFSGELFVYAQPGDTLGSFWAMERWGANSGGLAIQFGPDETFPQPQPWPALGIGSVAYDRTPGSARFRFFYVVPRSSVGPVRGGRRYVLGRILLGARHPGLDGCQRPVCLEWRSASMSYRADAPVVIASGSRLVSRGAAESDCVGRIPAWRPRTAGLGDKPPAGVPR